MTCVDQRPFKWLFPLGYHALIVVQRRCHYVPYLHVYSTFSYTLVTEDPRGTRGTLGSDVSAAGGASSFRDRY